MNGPILAWDPSTRLPLTMNGPILVWDVRTGPPTYMQPSTFLINNEWAHASWGSISITFRSADGDTYHQSPGKSGAVVVIPSESFCLHGQFWMDGLSDHSQNWSYLSSDVMVPGLLMSIYNAVDHL